MAPSGKHALMKIEHLGNGVVVFRNLVSDINSFDISLIEKNCQPQGFTSVEGKLYTEGGHEYDPDVNEINYPLRFSQNIYDVEFTEKLISAIYNAAVIYCRIFPSAIECVTEHQQFHYIKYKKNALIGAHSDCSASYKNNSIEVLSNKAITNTLSTSILLNDEFEGGNFEFPILGAEVELSAGDGIIFPSNFIGCHGIKEITSGIRWAFLSFFSHARTDFSTLGDRNNKYEWLKKFRSEVNDGNYGQQKVEVGVI
jgi:hypothetical protein